jgi:hypothetical protein
MILLHSLFITVAGFVLQPFLSDPNLKLLFVMILTPMVMNAFQFWVVDNIIKKATPDVLHHEIDDELGE